MRYRILLLSLLLTFLVSVPVVQGQGQPLVGFVVTNTLNTASLSDPGPDGLTILAQAFARQGGSPQILRLDEPIADEVQVVVLVGPTRALSTANLGFLWEYMTRGHNLLVALDPNGYQQVSTERATGGLNQLLRLEYGTQIDDNLLVQPWFLKAGLDDLRTNQIAALPDSFVPHPVLEPLTDFQLPVHIWGGRTVQVEPFGPDLSSAYPLLVVETAYGETSQRLFIAEDADPLEFDIASDAQGRLLLGGIGVNEVLGSRVAVLGDSEMLQNGFGLARLPGTETPRYPGNQILAERLAAWLLERPEEDWPTLPTGFTWLQVDGDRADWDTSLPPVTNATPETAPAGYSIGRVVATRNDAYVYLLIETVQTPAPTMEVAMVVNNNGQMIDLQLSSTSVTASTESDLLPDSALGIGEVIEIRLPQRVVGLSPRIEALCLVNPQNSTQRGCLNQAFSTRLLSTVDPQPLRGLSGPLTSVVSNGVVNLRSGPGTEFEITGNAANGALFVVTERTASGDWLRVISGRQAGWITESLIAFNADPNYIAGPAITPAIESESSELEEAPAFATNTPVPTVECFIGVTDLVNRRASPDATSEILGLLTPEEDLPATGQVPAGGELVWWQLADGGWVRSDVVIEVGDCELLPVVQP